MIKQLYLGELQSPTCTVCAWKQMGVMSQSVRCVSVKPPILIALTFSHNEMTVPAWITATCSSFLRF